MGTKQKILDVALALFNEQGTAAVSTNHIAAGAHISPGNLYYHFRHKQQIIRALFERLYQAYEPVWGLPANRPARITGMRRTLEQHFRLLWDYRFFHRELVALLRQDPNLAGRYRAIQQQRQAEQQALLQCLIEDGVLLAPQDPQLLISTLQAAWIISDQWLPYQEALGHRLEATVLDEALRVILHLFAPYMSGAAIDELKSAGEQS